MDGEEALGGAGFVGFDFMDVEVALMEHWASSLCGQFHFFS